MPLNSSPKSAQNAPKAPATPAPRVQVQYGQPNASTARVEALKAKINAIPTPPAPPRIARSSARQAEQSQLVNYAAPGLRGQVVPKGMPKVQEFQDVEPPPSGLVQSAPADQSVSEPIESAPGASEQNVESVAQDAPISPQFVALARRERQIRKAQQELKAEREALQREKANYIDRTALTSDPLKTLTEAGLSYDRLTELQLQSAQPPDPQQPLLDKIAALEAKLSEVDTKVSSSEQKAYDAALTQIHSDVELLVNSDPAYETTKALGKTKEVTGLIKRVFEEEGTVLSVEEAAKIYEQKLVEVEYQRYQRIAALNKIKAKLAPPTSETAEAIPQAAPQSSRQAPKSLSNSHSTSRPLSARDRAVEAVKRKLQGLE